MTKTKGKKMKATKNKSSNRFDPDLLTAANPKIWKGLKKSWFGVSLMLSPAGFSGYQVCPFRSPGCEADCLNTAGAGGGWGTSAAAARMTLMIQSARIARTKMFFENRKLFFYKLMADLEAALDFASNHSFTGRMKKMGMFFKPEYEAGGSMQVCARLNCTSDLRWESLDVFGKPIMEHFPDIQFYDYTKIPARFHLPENYHLTFSRSEVPESAGRSRAYYQHGINTAVVFSTLRTRELPHSWNGIQVFDGRVSDLRFLDPKNVIVGLSALGRAKLDETSGFVVQVGKGEKPGPQKNFDFGMEDGTDLFPDLML